MHRVGAMGERRKATFYLGTAELNTAPPHLPDRHVHSIWSIWTQCPNNATEGRQQCCFCPSVCGKDELQTWLVSKKHCMNDISQDLPLPLSPFDCCEFCIAAPLVSFHVRSILLSLVVWPVLEPWDKPQHLTFSPTSYSLYFHADS